MLPDLPPPCPPALVPVTNQPARPQGDDGDYHEGGHGQLLPIDGQAPFAYPDIGQEELGEPARALGMGLVPSIGGDLGGIGLPAPTPVAPGAEAAAARGEEPAGFDMSKLQSNEPVGSSQGFSTCKSSGCPEKCAATYAPAPRFATIVLPLTSPPSTTSSSSDASAVASSGTARALSARTATSTARAQAAATPRPMRTSTRSCPSGMQTNR